MSGCFPQYDSGKKVLYCGVCSYPLELCEYSATYEKCKTWWLENHKEYVELYTEAMDIEDFEGSKSKGSFQFGKYVCRWF